MTLAALIQVVVALGGLGGITAIFVVFAQKQKLKAEARRIDIDSSVAQQAERDDHWESLLAASKAITEAQVSALVEPLSVRVAELTAEVSELKRRFDSLSKRYQAAIGNIRALYRWIAEHAPDAVPAPPPVPDEIASDV